MGSRNAHLQLLLAPYFFRALANVAEVHLVNRVVEFLQRSPPGTMADQGARCLWDEICVGLQMDSSLSEIYLDHIRSNLEKQSRVLPVIERIALWFTTDSGAKFLEFPHAEIRCLDDIPVNDGEIAKNFVISVRDEAYTYENPWILGMTSD